ncbi:LOW QUALITY PROTEIN: uncharacterized protein LOC111730700 [Pteropus vampyrus]|uniref:LOW QUALITY PROTEIN: uncharacterized protein LOC111730700 n=1 Tax=Pteropus vampyrus TaxID=132908 RepID=A0A6P6BRW7_PTEVA|nr:LOW QUALITY PROTEIN: uncharacterized protein LOC111730700 [Pteropus vampyrus]
MGCVSSNLKGSWGILTSNSGQPLWASRNSYHPLRRLRIMPLVSPYLKEPLNGGAASGDSETALSGAPHWSAWIPQPWTRPQAMRKGQTSFFLFS